jgi:triosephosphate isomerase
MAIDTGLVGVSLKLHLGYAESRDWLHRVRALTDAAGETGGVELFVLPAFPLLPLAAELFAGTPVRYGAQNAHSAQRGAYTGEVSPAMLAELGCHYLEIGHAERRALFGETDAVIAAKTRAAAEAGLTPVLCVGEERPGPATAAADRVRDQLDAALAEFPAHLPLVVAYEPVWAIGAAAAASPSHITAVTGAVRAHLTDRPTRILYGGSAAPGLYPHLAKTADHAAQLPDGLFLGRSAHDTTHLATVLQEVGARCGADGGS